MIVQELLKTQVDTNETWQMLVKALLNHATFGRFLRAASEIQLTRERTEIRAIYPGMTPGEGMFCEIGTLRDLDIIRARIYSYLLSMGYDLSVVIRS